jgi:hypothetical protein
MVEKLSSQMAKMKDEVIMEDDPDHDYHQVPTGGGLQEVLVRAPVGMIPDAETSWGDIKNLSDRPLNKLAEKSKQQSYQKRCHCNCTLASRPKTAGT